MTNLVQELGVPYMVDRFQECMFYNEAGEVCYIDGTRKWDKNNIAVNVVNGTPEVPEIRQERMPYEFFKDLTVFSAPPLGWRQSAQGKYLVNFYRNNRSYHRAYAPVNINRRFAPSTRYLIDSSNLDRTPYDSPASTCLMVMRPQYTPFREGIEKMRRGEVLSFCVNPNVAVIPEVYGQQAVLFNMTRVAVVRPDGELMFTFPAVKNMVEEQL